MFTDHSHRLSKNAPARCGGVAVADLLGVGRPQLFVCGMGGQNYLLSWESGRLVDRTPRALAGGGQAAVAADTDGDGGEELLLLGIDPRHQPRLFHRDPAGQWHDTSPAATGRDNAPSAGSCVAAIDRRGGGRYGFVIACPARPARLLELGADGQLSDLAPPPGLDETDGGALWVGPLASDRPDLYLGRPHTANILLRNTGCGTFLEIGGAVGADDPSEAAVALAGVDAEDGRIALLVGNRDGANRLLCRQADGTFRDRATPAMAFPGALRAVVAADFDNDGHEELFFHFHGEPNRLFRRSTNGWVLTDAGPATEPDGFGTGMAVADLDDDGRLELLLAHGGPDPKPLSLFKVDAGDNHWLRVRPLTRFGAPARGAVVRLRAGGRTQLRVIESGGSLAQTEAVAHFGLGSVGVVSEVRVTWPDGATATVPTPPVRQQFDVRPPRS